MKTRETEVASRRRIPPWSGRAPLTVAL